jgi:hypothetical protein
MAFVFLLLKQDSLTLVTKINQPPPLVFPKTVVNHQEIIDRKAFETFLQDFFSHYPKLETTIFLLNEIVFEKAIPLNKEVIIEDEVKKFVESVPFPLAQVEKRIIQTKATAYLYATNNALYQTIIAIAQQNGWQVKSVLPLSLYSQFLQGREISYDSLSQVLKQKTHLKEGNFLQIDDKKPSSNKKLPAKQLLMLLICLLFLGTAVWFALDNLGLLPKSTSNTSSVTPQIVSPALQPTQKLSPSQAVISPRASKKEAIAIQISNGSGIVGQATKVKNQLSAIGFTNVQTGNTAIVGASPSATTVAFSDKVPAEFKDAILAELKTIFTSVITEKVPLSDGSDVSITTGKE